MRASTPLLDITTVPKLDHPHHQLTVVQVIDDPIVTHPQPPGALVVALHRLHIEINP